MKNRSEAFGRLLKAGIGSIVTCEGKKAPVVEDDLGQQIGVSADAIQRYKAGALPPEPRTVQILAEACVRRGFLGREWLQRFLHAARYHQADALLDQLCPLGPARLRPPRVYENLPAPTYSQFVMREQVFAEVIDGLQQRSATVLIVGLGGNGKTSLAREVAAACLQDNAQTPRFDSVVWVSDKDRPSTTNLSTVLDEIARTLDYPGFTQFEHDEKRREVEQLLRQQKVLLVVDNFETITDGALLTWLLRLPEPSKVIITTREYWREFRRGGWPVELRGMSEAEAWELISERARVLKIERLISERAQLEPLLAATGGNPKALTITMGLLKYERRPLQQVVDDLYTARGELFNDLFARAWALLDEASRRVLLVATFFPTSASTEALSASADVQGFAFDRAVERLADLALLDVQQEDLSTPPRYVLHPLVRAFASAKLVEHSGFEAGARERWVAYFTFFVANEASKLEHAIDAIELAILDSIEVQIETIHTVLDFCHRMNQWVNVATLTVAMEEFWQRRGYFRAGSNYAHRALRMAQIHNDWSAQIQLLSFVARDAYYQNNSEEAQQVIAQAQTLLDSIKQPEDSLLIRYYKARRNVYRLQRDVKQWYAVSQHIIAIQKLPQEAEERRQLYARAEYLYLTNQHTEAEDLLLKLVDESPFDSSVHRIGRWLLLVRIAIHKQQPEVAYERLAIAEDIAVRVNHRGYLARMTLDRARIEMVRANDDAARKLLLQAINEFERYGSLRDLAAARADLAKLESAGTSGEDAPAT